MPQPKEYYFNNLYPLQDIVLNVIAGCTADFYLTGGTALSRFYLHHRFSDDLDFFLNNVSNFSNQVDVVISALRSAGIAMTVGKKADDFVRIVCRNNSGVELTIDFVNDIPYHAGDIQKFSLFPRVDGWQNILSNKICALERREPKDVADILFLCKKFPFEWEKIFDDAQQKTTYIDPIDVSLILSEFPEEYFSFIRWVSDELIHGAYADIQIIAKDILGKKENSLVQQYNA